MLLSTQKAAEYHRGFDLCYYLMKTVFKAGSPSVRNKFIGPIFIQLMKFLRVEKQKHVATRIFQFLCELILEVGHDESENSNFLLSTKNS